VAFGLLGMVGKCGQVAIFQGWANKFLAGRDSKSALALIIKMLSRYLAVALPRCLAATIFVRSLGFLWRRQRDLNQYSCS
jgi:hypothetical protein